METLTRNDSIKQAFAGEARRLREQAGHSQIRVGELLAEHGGDKVSGSAVGLWENGENYPSRRNVLALERVYGCDPGHLASMIGYRVDEPTQADQIDAMRREIAELRQQIKDHLSREQ